jgi:hypothetical protein
VREQVVAGEVPLVMVVEVLEPSLTLTLDRFVARFGSEHLLGFELHCAHPKPGAGANLDESAAEDVVHDGCMPSDSPGGSDPVAKLAAPCAVARVEEALDLEGAGQGAEKAGCGLLVFETEAEWFLGDSDGAAVAVGTASDGVGL